MTDSLHKNSINQDEEEREMCRLNKLHEPFKTNSRFTKFIFSLFTKT